MGNEEEKVDSPDIEETVRKDVESLIENIKKYDDFFNHDIGKSLLEYMESALMNIARQKVIPCWSNSDEDFLKCFSYDGKVFGTDDDLEPYEVFEKAMQANFEFFKQCLSYKWSIKK